MFGTKKASRWIRPVGSSVHCEAPMLFHLVPVCHLLERVREREREKERERERDSLSYSLPCPLSLSPSLSLSLFVSLSDIIFSIHHSNLLLNMAWRSRVCYFCCHKVVWNMTEPDNFRALSIITRQHNNNLFSFTQLDVPVQLKQWHTHTHCVPYRPILSKILYLLNFPWDHPHSVYIW